VSGELRDHGFDTRTDIEVFEPNGCERCNDTGYRGRVGVFEVLVLSDQIRSMILERASADEVRKVAVKQGMRRLRSDGFLKRCVVVMTRRWPSHAAVDVSAGPVRPMVTAFSVSEPSSA